MSHEDVLYTVIGIGEYAFYQCAALDAIILPDGILSLGANAFAHCTGLRAVTLGNAVVSLDRCSFANCTALEEFYSPVSPSPAAAEAFPDASTSTCVLYVPVGAKGDYSSAEGWEEFGDIVEMTAFFIETLAATDISGTAVTLHGTVVAAYNDPIIEKGFEYWTGNEEAQHIVVEGEEMTATVTGLTYATQYTYRAYACTDSGTTYGAALSFTTAESPSSGDDDDSAGGGNRWWRGVWRRGADCGGMGWGGGVLRRGEGRGTPPSPSPLAPLLPSPQPLSFPATAPPPRE